MRKMILAFTVLLLLSLQYNIYGQRFRDKKSKNFTVPAFILRKFDKNNDGKISSDERKAIIASRKGKTEETGKYTQAKDSTLDILTPQYYKNSKVKKEIDRFLVYVRKEKFHHPLKNSKGIIADYKVSARGVFGYPKGRTRKIGHHAAVDLYFKNPNSKTSIYAAHDGIAATVKDAPKYRNYLSITKLIKDDKANVIGKLVTIYAHIDLSLDEKDSLSLNGKKIKKGDLISLNLYSGTKGGAHLHFETRYYRANDKATEEFYGFRGSDLSEKSAAPWVYGKWNPKIGYGFGNPVNHNLKL